MATTPPEKQLQPIIIKRVKKGGHGAHGGAWKIAYADFVTAMMAFFLLMWLLGSTTEGDLKGIADYFSAPMKISMPGGPGTGSSDSILPAGGQDLSKSVGQVSGGESSRDIALPSAQSERDAQAKIDQLKLEALKQKIENLINTNPKLSEYKSQIRLEKVVDGLHIQIVDEQNRPMFDTGSAVVKPYMRDILREIGKALNDVENQLAIAGHTDSMPYGSGDRGYSNWELSADRANASRRELVVGGMPDNKLLRVLGMAASSPFLPEDTLAAINRRISIIIMTQEAVERLNKTFETKPIVPGLGINLPAFPGQPALPVQRP